MQSKENMWSRLVKRPVQDYAACTHASKCLEWPPDALQRPCLRHPLQVIDRDLMCKKGEFTLSPGVLKSSAKLALRRLWNVQSTYTGVYKKGGPTCVEPGKQLSDLVDRSPADIRGRKKGAQEMSPLQTSSGNNANSARKPAPIITTLLPTHSGR